VNCIRECVLNVLKGNIKLPGCNTRKLNKHKAAPRKVAERHGSLSGKKRLIVQRGGFLLPLLAAILRTIASLIFKAQINMLRKMYLVPADHYHRGTNDATLSPRLASGRKAAADVKKYTIHMKSGSQVSRIR